MPNPATDRLVEAIRAQKPSRARDELAARAAAFEFHDFKSEHAAPKSVLVRALAGAGFMELAEQVGRGEFDEGRVEAMEWAETEEGKHCIGALIEGAELVGIDPNDLREVVAGAEALVDAEDGGA